MCSYTTSVRIGEPDNPQTPDPILDFRFRLSDEEAKTDRNVLPCFCLLSPIQNRKSKNQSFETLLPADTRTGIVRPISCRLKLITTQTSSPAAPVDQRVSCPEKLAHVVGCFAKRISEVRPVRHETAVIDELPKQSPANGFCQRA
jgi:hypothetical protein